ncbi:MAG: hypothetical protein ACOVN0_15965 [Niveispirillum sp.]|uniref:hypothetical protein n=1 Tax=Niveispirillum sp. TaxID=1917217 RepID=UPI003BA70182
MSDRYFQAPLRALAATLAFCLLAPTQALAIDGPSAAVAVKALNFVQPKPAKPIPVAIVVDAGQTAAGDAIKGALGADIAAKVVEGGGDIAGAAAVIVVGKADMTAKTAAGQLVIGDMACMEAGRCALSVERQASGAAKYHVNSAALAKTAVAFDKNFQMLVTAH